MIALKCLFHYAKTNQTLMKTELHGLIDLVRLLTPQNNNGIGSQNIYFAAETLLQYTNNYLSLYHYF